MKTTIFVCLAFSFSLLSPGVQAGKIYRFLDKDGVSTLSKELPPYAAQQGYDILDDKSLRLIERVYSREELIQIQKQQQIEAQKAQEKLKRQQEARRKLLQQRARDRNLLARYPTEDIFIKSRDEDLRYRANRVKELKSLLDRHQQHLITLQNQAAAAELDGEAISDELKQNMADTENEIKLTKRRIRQLQQENKVLAQQYQKDYDRLRELFAKLKTNQAKPAKKP